MQNEAILSLGPWPTGCASLSPVSLRGHSWMWIYSPSECEFSLPQNSQYFFNLRTNVSHQFCKTEHCHPPILSILLLQTLVGVIWTVLFCLLCLLTSFIFSLSSSFCGAFGVISSALSFSSLILCSALSNLLFGTWQWAFISMIIFFIFRKY